MQPEVPTPSSSAAPGQRSGPATVNPAFRAQLSYIDRSREYYRAKGFTTPYRWVKNTSAPFTPLTKPLSAAKVGVVTTSFPHDVIGDKKNVNNNQKKREVEKKVVATPSSPVPESMFTQDLFWHKKATHTDDVESFLPLNTLIQYQAEGRIGSLSERFYSVPTLHGHRRTRADADRITELCLEDNLDVVLLIPL